MKRMAFSITTKQMYEHTKTVTRRLGWSNLQAGDVILAIEKGMGLKKGEHQIAIYPIKILSVNYEILSQITQEDVIKEGFPDFDVPQFVRMFCKANRCESSQGVNRIEFEEAQNAEPKDN